MTRYLALDAFRGLTIALMILVNTPGSWDYSYGVLMHADWHGATPTDLIFPFFLFIIGSAMFFSFRKTNFSFSTEQLIHIVKRGGIIFFIGLVLSAYPFIEPLSSIRVMGVLQRIGLAYIIAAMLILLLNRRGIWLVSIGILLGYWLLLASVGAEHAYTLEHNIVRQFDLWLLGEHHIWSGKGLPFDPEGVLSTIPAVVNVLIGFEITRYITSFLDKKRCVAKLIQLGLLSVVTAGLWHYVMPINKSLWTSSYVLFSSGMACLLLAFFIFITDIKAKTTAIGPLLVYGTNPLFIYVLSWLWVTSYLYVSVGDIDFNQWVFNQLAAFFLSTKFASFFFAFFHVVLFWFISQALFKRKIFIKI
jgi:predicted acyltransferase